MSEPITAAYLDHLAALEAAATKGPWYQHCTPPGPGGAMCYHETVESSSEYPPIAICERPRRGHVKAGKAKQTFADMQFIAESRTAMPRLIDAARRYLLETDPTPLSVEGLASLGYSEPAGPEEWQAGVWSRGDGSAVVHREGNGWVATTVDVGPLPVRTLGELRTLVRLVTEGR